MSIKIEKIIRQIIREELQAILNKESDELPQLMELPEVLEYTKIGRSTLYTMIDKGAFPRPLKNSERSNVWKKSDIRKWIESK